MAGSVFFSGKGKYNFLSQSVKTEARLHQKTLKQVQSGCMYNLM